MIIIDAIFTMITWCVIAFLFLKLAAPLALKSFVAFLLMCFLISILYKWATGER